ncbi:MAG: tetratricopeptide repeat protein [Candidatus Hydrogenedentes bacterium]|nr:tetratricopeptide repeat protein [Candidatus Hydrogenedentota bacterium]
MSKGTGVLLAALILLLAVQTWRLHEAKREIGAGSVPGDAERRDGQPQMESSAPADASSNAIRSPVRPVAADDEVNHPVLPPAGEVPKDVLTALREFAQRSVAKPAGNTADKSGKEGTRGRAETDSRSASDSTKRTANGAAGPEKAALREGIARARAAARNGDYGKAIALLTGLIDSTADSGPAYQALARTYRDLGMPDEALAVLQEWSSAHPDAAAAHLEMANTYEALGLNAEALAELQAYENLSGGSADSYSELAAMYRRLGLTAEEAQALVAWNDASPGSPQAMRAMADYYRRNGDYGNAILQYQGVLEAEPGNIAARTNLAQTYQQMGQYGAAQAEYIAALELTPGDANLWMRLGDSYRQSGNIASAIGSYQSVVSLEPGSSSALRASRQIVRLERQLTAQKS